MNSTARSLLALALLLGLELPRTPAQDGEAVSPEEFFPPARRVMPMARRALPAEDERVSPEEFFPPARRSVVAPLHGQQAAAGQGAGTTVEPVSPEEFFPPVRRVAPASLRGPQTVEFQDAAPRADDVSPEEFFPPVRWAGAAITRAVAAGAEPVSPEEFFPPVRRNLPAVARTRVVDLEPVSPEEFFPPIRRTAPMSARLPEPDLEPVSPEEFFPPVRRYAPGLFPEPALEPVSPEEFFPPVRRYAPRRYVTEEPVSPEEFFPPVRRMAVAPEPASAEEFFTPTYRPVAGNPQQPAPLPGDPLRPGELPEPGLLPEELPILNEPFPLESAGSVETPKPPSARFKLQLALDAVEPILPPLPSLANGISLAASVHISVKKFVFEGNHVYSDRALAKVVASYTGRVITPEELEEARVALTKHYVEAGYITSGAVLPDQDVKDGIVRVQIVEGRLAEVDLRGEKWFRSWWLRNEIRQAAGQPLNFTKLKMGIQLLRQNPLISRINAEVKPGVNPGESIIEMAVKDEQPFRAGFELSNKRPPSVSEGLGELFVTGLNLTGHNDPMDLRWGLVRWDKDGRVDYSRFDNISGTYSFPVTPWGTTLELLAARTDASVIDETFAELGISSRFEELTATLRQPLYRTLNDTVALAVTADRKHSETFLLGEPFTLANGAIDGESTVFATRFSMDWVNRSQRHVLAVRSVFSLGLYAFDSTRHDPRTESALSGGDPLRGFEPEIPDSKFFSWLGQAQYVWRAFDTEALRKKPDTRGWNTLRETTLLLRANAQFSDEPLLSIEQFSIGGVQSVRGYRENQLLRDDGIFASAEIRIPLWLAKDKSPIVSLAPFFDFAAGWDINKVDDHYQTIYSAGAGLLVNATKHAQMSLYWGHAFVDFNEPKVSFQDYGFHFSITLNAF